MPSAFLSHYLLGTVFKPKKLKLKEHNSNNNKLSVITIKQLRKLVANWFYAIATLPFTFHQSTSLMQKP